MMNGNKNNWNDYNLSWEKQNNHYNNNKQENKSQEDQQTSNEEGFDHLDAREETIATLRRELDEEKQRHLRTRADFDNYRKRMEREVEAKRIYAKKEIIEDLLTFLDYFDQAKKQVQDPAAAEGIKIMARQLKDLLHKHGVRPVECLGLPFDPEEQEGIGYLETQQYDDGCVCEEISPGYRLHDILLKPARVMVARKPDTENPEDTNGNNSLDGNNHN